MAEAFLSWDNLATFSGAVAAVVFIVQFLKLPLDKLKKVPTRIVVYAVAFAVLLAGHLFTGKTFGVEMVALCLINAILVALSAMSLYEQTIAEPEAIKHDDIIEGTATAITDIVHLRTGLPLEVDVRLGKDESTGVAVEGMELPTLPKTE